MSRFIRLYEKKRGHRRTGSKAFGKFGEALFFALFFAVGCAAFAVMFVLFAWPEWRANRQFASADCVVLDKEVSRVAESASQPASYRPEIRIRYTVDGRQYEESTYDVTRMHMADQAAAQAIVDEFEVGEQYICWYDPLDPHRAVLVRGYSWWLYLTLLIPLSFTIIGGGGLTYTLLHWNASAEMRALLTQRAAQLDLFETASSDRTFPTVPADVNQTNSPGTTLAYRLPIATTTSWNLFGALAACLLWNAIVSIFVVMAARSFSRGEPDWMLAIFITPFALAGVALVVYLVRHMLIATGIGTTRLEISNHPLSPGEEYGIFLSQAGRLSMDSLEVYLACDEKASYRQGTDTRTESRRVYQQRCFVRQEFEIHQGLPFESHCQISVPECAMHSFQADHNEVNWKLIVKGSAAGRRDYERVFPIVVNPYGAQAHRGNGRRNGHAHP